MSHKVILPITLVIVISFGLICYMIQSYNYSVRKLNELNEEANTKLIDDHEPLKFIDLNDKEVMKEQLRKIRHFEMIEGDRIRHLIPEEIEEELKKDKLRSLAENNVFDTDVVIVDPNKDPYDRIKTWFVRNMKQFSSNIVLYPYSFDFVHKTATANISKHYEQGGFISLKPEELNGISIGQRTNSTLSIKKARALFDADIAILSVIGDVKEINLTNYELFLDASDWCTYFQNYLGKSTCYSTYGDFLRNKGSNSQKALVTKINETSINEGALMDEGLPRFGILIIPDYRAGSDQIILSKIGKDGINKIIEFYNAGGIILVTGKSGALFEDFGLIAKGTYNRKKLLSIDTNDRKVSTTGCEGTFNQTYKSDVDFKKQMICLSMKVTRKICISSTFLTQKLDTTFETLIGIDQNETKLVLHDTDSGFEEQLTDAQRDILPLVLHKANEKNGQIFLMNFNPVFGGGDRNIILNTLSLAFSRELYLTSNVTMNINSIELPTMTIPQGESGFNVEANVVLHNLNDMAISDCKLYIFLPNNLNWTDIPKTCSLNKNLTTIPISVRKKKTVQSTNDYLLCNLGKIDVYQKYSFKITVTILNHAATQSKYNVLLLEPFAVYTDSLGKVNTLVDYVRVNCEAAPVLRISINSSPSSFYPLKGEGQYVDNVIKIENKEQTGAFDAEYVGVIPLISPLIDSDDQSKILWNLKLYVDYYNTDNKFEVPFKSDDAQDFIFVGLLKGKGAVIVSEWDSPVLPVKQTITKEQIGDNVLDEEVDLLGINFGMITINRNSEIIKQVNYRKSDALYKLASHRLMVFIDDSTAEGATTLHKGFTNIPDIWKDNELKDRAKREFIFARLDIFFYNNENYANSSKINEKVIFSIDQKVPYVQNKNNCAKVRGNARSKIITKGFFSNLDANTKNKILEPNIYSNELFEYCDLTVINPLDVTAIKTYFGNNDYFKPVHYVIANIDNSITRPKQIYNFTQVSDYEGYHSVYKSIKFIYVHTLDFIISKSKCSIGGKITVNLGNYLINGIEDVTVAPDQIAVHKIVYENNKIMVYFKRGVVPNEQISKNLGLKINIENLQDKDKKRITTNVQLTMDIEEMKYDISLPPDYESYTTFSSEKMTFEFKSAWSLPALEIKSNLGRKINGYETMETFTRFGLYIQEINHRTVYGTGETHFERDPGIVANGAGFSLISNIGTSSVPFIEYLTLGKKQLIPAGTGTSRTTWLDAWGRGWHQHLGSVFPDVPSSPPPFKNLMMTTTYEILNNNNNEQIYEWSSDEAAKIHLHIKLINNYPKYFEITRCQKNQIRFIPKSLGEYHEREYSAKSSVHLEDSDFKNSNNLYLRLGGYASYGACFSDKDAIVDGQSVGGSLSNNIQNATLCADYISAQRITECEQKLKDVATLHKVDTTNSKLTGKQWNYSPSVESYYPQGYIEDNMWDLTHDDYDNNNIDKGYRYHRDNLLPNYDNTIIKPHNTIAIPLYKGLGYNINYNKNNNMNYHGEVKKGWWVDNLQNKDDTILAGQDMCNKISIDKKLSVTRWVDGLQLKGNDDDSSQNVTKIISERNKNIYVCLFNRKRPDITKQIDKQYYAGNINENNIIPIIIDLENDDPRLTNYNCTGQQYLPTNIQESVNNLLVTPSSKDYLYFAANLRGHAKESFNVLMNMNAFGSVKYEGMVKVNEGGRFVYKNPTNGPNNFIVVDNPVNIVNAKRNDIDISNDLFPLRVSTFNSVVYHSYTFRDATKVNKVWPFSDYYTNSFGFGDVVTSVYVGGTRDSKAVIQPGSTTYAKIIFYNNCGFDWEMKGNAIEFDIVGSKPIDATDLLSRHVHTIKAPRKYNFLTYTVDKDYQKYIQIRPSDHNIEVAPEFYDFENINVVTIRDGFKGEYNLQINVTNDLPNELRGKPIEIKIGLKTEYFDRFPGTSTDPIPSFHKYTVKVPSVYIGVPYADGPFSGKVLYTSAQASNLNLSFDIAIDWKIDGIKYVDKATLNSMTLATQKAQPIIELDNIWNKLNQNVKYTETVVNKDTKRITFDGIKQDYRLFPKIMKGQPDIAEVSIVIKSKVAQLQYGYTSPINNVLMKYNNWNGREKSSNGRSPSIYAGGAWIRFESTNHLVEYFGNGKYFRSESQVLSHEIGGYIEITFGLTNVGNANSFNTRYQIVLEKNIKYSNCSLGINLINSTRTTDGLTIVTFNLNAPINQGEKKGGIIYLEFDKVIESYANLTPEEIKKLPKYLPVIKESRVIMDLTEKKGENEVTQIIRTPVQYPYKVMEGALVYIHMHIYKRRINPLIIIKPVVKPEGKDNIDTVQFRISKIDLTEYSDSQNKTNYTKIILCDFADGKKTIEDQPNVKEMSNKKHLVKYMVDMKRNDDTLAYNFIIYDQTKVGISLLELIIIIAAIILFALTIIFIILAYNNYKYVKSHRLQRLEKEIDTMDKLLD